MLRAAVYTRISLDKTGEGAGVERQREDCAELIERRGWRHVATFPEKGSVSAKAAGKRPQFAALLAAVERGEVDVIVAWALDRLTRNARDRLGLIEACQRRNVIVALVRGSDLDPTTPNGRMLMGILGEVAQNEIETKGDRQRRALAQRAAQGKPWGPTAAFGYADDRTTVVESEAVLIKSAYAAVLAGASCRSVAREWTAAGVLTRTGKPWSGAAVKRLLINPRYMGIRAVAVGHHRHEWREIGRAAWPAIVDEDVWRGAHAILTDPGRTTTTQRARVHLLPGIAKCGRCGAPMRSYVHSRGWSAYSCAESRHMVRKAEPVDELVSEVIIARLSRPDARELLVDDTRPDAAELREKAAALRARIEATRAAFVDDDTMTPAQLRELLAGLQGRLAEVEAAMTETTRAPVLAELISGDDVRRTWDGLSLDRRRMVISTLLEITILPARRGPGFDPESVQVDWRP